MSSRQFGYSNKHVTQLSVSKSNWKGRKMNVNKTVQINILLKTKYETWQLLRPWNGWKKIISFSVHQDSKLPEHSSQNQLVLCYQTWQICVSSRVQRPFLKTSLCKTMNELLFSSGALLSNSIVLLETNLFYWRPTDPASQILDQSTLNLYKRSSP